MKIYPLLVYILLGITACRSNKTPETDTLQNEITGYLHDKQATVGVSVLTDSCNIVSHNDTVLMPTLSVFKFPLAMAVLHKMNASHTPLDTLAQVSPSDLKPNTYSPLRDKYPNQKFTIGVDSLLYYSICLSDNNACDILLSYAGGPKAVEQYIRSLNIKDIYIGVTEDDMHRDPECVYRNCATPAATSLLMKTFLTKKLFDKEYYEYLYNLLVQTATGTNKLRAGVPEHITLGHKTGSSDRNSDGMKIADNDAGFVLLPDGRRYYITVFVIHSMENDSVNAQIIADISQKVYKHFTAQQ